MRDQTLMYWGMVVTMFLLIAAMITARDVFEMYLARRRTERGEDYNDEPQPSHKGVEPPG